MRPLSFFSSTVRNVREEEKIGDGQRIPARLALDHAYKKLCDPEIRLSQSMGLVQMLQATRWSYDVIAAAGSGKIYKILQISRNLKPPRLEYGEVDRPLTQHFERGRDPLHRWEIRGDLIDKYQPPRTIDRATFSEAVVSIHKEMVWAPALLADIPKKHVTSLDHTLDNNGAVLMLWLCARCRFDYPCGSGAHRSHKGRAATPSPFLRIRGKSVGDTDLFRRHREMAQELGATSDFAGLTPSNKEAALRAAAIGPSRLTEFLAMGDDLNALNRAEYSTPALRSGIASYLRFGTLLGRPDLPTTSGPPGSGAGPSIQAGPSINNWLSSKKRLS